MRAYKVVSRRILKKESDTLLITTRLEILMVKAIRCYKRSTRGRIVYKKAAKIRAKS